MSEADDMTQRYLALWAQYLAALLADPQAMETLKRWASFTQQFGAAAPGDTKPLGSAAPFPAWPPFFGPFGLSPIPPGGAAAAAPADLSDLIHRLDELERRIGDLEAKRKPARPRRENRGEGR